MTGTDTWHLDCPKPEVWDELPPSDQREWIEAVVSIAKIQKLPINEVATRCCDWHWSPLSREIANG